MPYLSNKTTINFLGHAYLSFGRQHLLTGNMISDCIKGKKQYELPPAIQEGIILHRQIDRFTDAHESTRIIMKSFKPYYGHYAGPFADVVYDYFLANDRTIFPSEEALMQFTLTTYAQLDETVQWHGPLFSAMYPYMKQQNWLYHYKDKEGMQKSFDGLMRRSRYITETHSAARILREDEELFKKCYDSFMPDMVTFVMNYIASL